MSEVAVATAIMMVMQVGVGVLADNLLGDDLLAWFVLALGGALFIGNVLALIKPPPRAKPGELARAPRGRTLLMALIGFVAAVWALGSLVS